MEVILAHYYDIAAVILFGIGFFTLLLHRNLIKKNHRIEYYGYFHISISRF